jgi:ATP-binding cassette subfamily B protein RaxB
VSWFPGRRSLACVLQAESAECGLACLAMIAGYHGRPADLNDLRTRYALSSRGAALPDLLGIARELGLVCRALHCEPRELAELRVPALLHWDQQHFVVLARAGRRGVRVHDPALGVRDFPMAEAAHRFTGVAVEFEPRADFAPALEARRLALADLWRGLPGAGLALAHLFALSLLLQLFALASPFYLQLVVDEVMIRHDADLLPLLAMGFALLTVVGVVTRAIRGLAGVHLAARLSGMFAAGLLHRLIRLPLEYFARRQAGDLLSRFESLKPVQAFLTGGSVAMVIDGLLAVSTLCLMAIYAASLAAVVAAGVSLQALLRLLQIGRLREASLEAVAAGARLESSLLESLRLLQGIKLAGREVERETAWGREMTVSLNAASRQGRLGVLAEAGTGALTGLEQVLVVFLGARAVLDGGMTLGMLYAFMAYRTSFAGAAASVIDTLAQYRLLAVHLDRLSDILLARPEPGIGAQGRFLVPIRGDLELRAAGFAYPGAATAVFEDLSLRLPAGSFTAILGPSGVGKSTLLRVLMGLHPPTAGTLRVDGHELASLGLDSYRAAIAAVTPEDGLFAGTLAENIAFFDAVPDHERLLDAARGAGLDDDIAALPLGYDSRVQEQGGNLSRGQQQRVLIARALYRRPRILFLDEGTSHVDARTGASILGGLRARGLNCVYVTHDEALLAFADRVLRWPAGGRPQLREPVGQAVAEATGFGGGDAAGRAE